MADDASSSRKPMTEAIFFRLHPFAVIGLGHVIPILGCVDDARQDRVAPPSALASSAKLRRSGARRISRRHRPPCPPAHAGLRLRRPPRGCPLRLPHRPDCGPQHVDRRQDVEAEHALEQRCVALGKFGEGEAADRVGPPRRCARNRAASTSATRAASAGSARSTPAWTAWTVPAASSASSPCSPSRTAADGRARGGRWRRRRVRLPDAPRRSRGWLVFHVDLPFQSRPAGHPGSGTPAARPRRSCRWSRRAGSPIAGAHWRYNSAEPLLTGLGLAHNARSLRLASLCVACRHPCFLFLLPTSSQAPPIRVCAGQHIVQGRSVGAGAVRVRARA